MFLPPVAIPLDADRQRKFDLLVRAALRFADLSLDQAAREAERDVRQFARQISGEVGSLPSLMKQPDRFWQWLGVTIAQEFGVPKEVKRAALLRRVALGYKRQLRVSAQQREERAS